MDLEEYLESLRKKKARKLYDIEIDEITLCASPANRKKFYITKRSQTMTKDFNNAIDMAEKFLDEDIEKTGKVDGKKLKKAMESILAYKDDMPDELKDAIDVILRCIAGYGGPTKKSQVDDYPSIPIVGPASVLEKMVNDTDDEEDDEDGEWG